MTFQQLQYLLEVNRSNSIRKAAAKLFVAPSSISACVNSLEEELGFPLFIWTQKGLTPTPQGQSILDYAQRICNIYDKMIHVQKEATTPVRISCFDYAPPCIAFARLTKELQSQKNLSPSLVNLSQPQTIQMLTSGELDVGTIAHFSMKSQLLEARLQDAELRWQALATIPYAAAVGPDHPLWGRESITIRELADYTLIDTGGRIYSTEILSLFMKTMPEQMLPIGNTLARREATLLGVGYSIELMPPRTVREADALHYIPIENLRATFYAVTNPHAPVTVPAERYIQLLKEELSKI